jgi:hypothetical protein
VRKRGEVILINIEIPISQKISVTEYERIIERIAESLGISLQLKTTLKKYPGCIHWHYKKGKERGTLEITLWPQQHRLWFTIHEGRKAEWIEEKMMVLEQKILTYHHLHQG